jgi:hypothetical protein
MRAPLSATQLFPAWRPVFAPLGRGTVAVVRTLRQATLAQIELRLGPALPAALLVQNPSAAHSRERIFTLSRTVWSWLWQSLQAQTSCREVVRQVQALFALHEARPVDEGTAAYCQARSKLPTALLEQLFTASARSAEQAAPPPARALLEGRAMRVVDGSGARLADTPGLRSAFPPSSSLTPGTGFPYLRVVALFSLLSGALLAQVTGSLQVSELRLWLQLLPHLQPGDILLGDRAFAQYVVIALLQGAGVDFLGAVATRRRNIDFRRASRRLAKDDALFVWRRGAQSALLDLAQWKELPAEITVRVLRVHLERRGFRSESYVLVTTLVDPVRYPAAEIISAYLRRWRMEMCLDDLKTTLGMEQLRCRNEQMVQKELLVFLTAYNLTRWLLAQAATHAHVDLDRLSFKGALDGFRQWSQAMAQHHGSRVRKKQLWFGLLRAIAADLLPLRPGRHEPRAVKGRTKYPHLSQPRHGYAGRWSRTKRRRMANAKKKTRS